MSRIRAFMREWDKVRIDKRFPGYVNKWVFRSFFVLMLIVVVAEAIVGGGFVSYSIECPAGGSPCKNPYYECSNYIQITGCSMDVPDRVCEFVPCDQEYIQPGMYHGRSDFFYRYGVLFVLGTIPAAFLINHLVYYFKTGYIKYRRK